MGDEDKDVEVGTDDGRSNCVGNGDRRNTEVDNEVDVVDAVDNWSHGSFEVEVEVEVEAEVEVEVVLVHVDGEDDEDQDGQNDFEVQVLEKLKWSCSSLKVMWKQL